MWKEWDVNETDYLLDPYVAGIVLKWFVFIGNLPTLHIFD
jgi:hypothetical protein